MRLHFTFIAPLLLCLLASCIVNTNAAWSEWHACSVSCGNGTRYRTCESGDDCEGSSIEPCVMPDCSSSSSGGSMESSSTAAQGESSSTGVEESSSSSTGDGLPSLSSTGSLSSSTAQGSTGGGSGSSSSTGGGEESSSSAGSSGGGSTGEDCGRGTYSATGFTPCTPCPNNTYANIRETECTPCPDHMHIPDGTVADSLTRCICDDGYTSLWASGGPCYPDDDETPSYDYCGQGTYSDTGTEPCDACPNNTYANVGETECTACPDNMHILGGGAGASITECVCDDGYESQWATGGPCYRSSNNTDSSSGEQGQGESSSTGIDESSSGGSSSNNSCSQYTTGFTCLRDLDCQPVYAHSCKLGKWRFVSCESRDFVESASQNATCAKDSNGNRAWFPSRAIPDDWTVIPINKKCGACCRADHQPRPGQNGTGNVGTGCSFVNGSACVLIEFQGACPSNSTLNTWRAKVIQAIATIVSSRLNVSRSDATIDLSVGAVPQTVGNDKICAVHLQIFPPRTGDLTANDFMMAIWEQLGGDSLLSMSKDTDSSSSSDLPSNVAGIAGYRTYGSLPQTLDDDTQDTIIIDTSSGNMVGTTAAVTTLFTTTIAAVLFSL